MPDLMPLAALYKYHDEFDPKTNADSLKYAPADPQFKNAVLNTLRSRRGAILTTDEIMRVVGSDDSMAFLRAVSELEAEGLIELRGIARWRAKSVYSDLFEVAEDREVLEFLGLLASVKYAALTLGILDLLSDESRPMTLAEISAQIRFRYPSADIADVNDALADLERDEHVRRLSRGTWESVTVGAPRTELRPVRGLTGGEGKSPPPAIDDLADGVLTCWKVVGWLQSADTQSDLKLAAALVSITQSLAQLSSNILGVSSQLASTDLPDVDERTDPNFKNLRMMLWQAAKKLEDAIALMERKF